MFYTVYQIINKINGKVYVGKHMTKDLDDGYMGSGKLIRRAIKKHGKENFKKEILHVFDNEEAMNAKEAELVVVSEETYNLCDGGKGGWSYINRLGLSLTEKHAIAAKENIKKGTEKFLELLEDEKWKSFFCKKIKDTHYSKKENYLNPFKGKKHSDSTKNKIGISNSNKQSGEKNSQHGTCWITNGIENKKIKKNDTIPFGWSRGRIMTSLRTGIIGNTQVSET